MTGAAARLALVIGSRFGARGDPLQGLEGDRDLDFVEMVTLDFAHQLSSRGGWSIFGGAPLLNPESHAAERAIFEAVAQASEAGIPLLIHFLGHGRARAHPHRPSNLYLQFRDSAPDPDSRTSVDLIHVLSEALGVSTGIDGLILLIDACFTGDVPVTTVVEVAPFVTGRLEVLVASDSTDSAAYDGCFTRTLVQVVANGSSDSGDYLYPARLLGALTSACTGQVPLQLSLNSGERINTTAFDEGLWLAPNVARQTHALTGRPDAARVELLLRDVSLSSAQLQALASLEEAKSQPLRVLRGPAGAGKSALAAALINPDRAWMTLKLDQAQRPQPVTAAVFLDSVSTTPSVVMEIAEQLHARYPSFARAHDAARKRDALGIDPRPSSDSADRQLLAPMRDWLAEEPAIRVHILFDGIDQVEERHRPSMSTLIRHLTDDADLGQIRVIVTERERDGPHPVVQAPATVVHLRAPKWSDTNLIPGSRAIAHPETTSMQHAANDSTVIPGGWLTVRLMAELAEHLRMSQQSPMRLQPDAPDVRHADIGRTTWALQARISSSLGALATTAVQVLKVLAVTPLGPTLPIGLLLRALQFMDLDDIGSNDSKRITTAELRTIVARLGPLVQRGQAGTADEHIGLAHSEIRAQFLTAYAAEIIRSHSALSLALAQLSADGRGAWTPSVLRYAENAWPLHALSAGDATSAVRALESLDSPADPRGTYERWQRHVDEIENRLGPCNRSTLIARNSVAGWLGESGDGKGALDGLRRVYAKRLRAFGRLDRDTLRTRNSRALWLARTGSIRAAVSEFERTLRERREALPPDDKDVLRTWNNHAYWLGRLGHPTIALREFRQLHPLRREVAGVDSVDSHKTWNNYAYFLGQCGLISESLAEYDLLIASHSAPTNTPDREALTARYNRASVWMLAGLYLQAETELLAVKRSQIELLTPHHPDVLETRSALADAVGKQGDAQKACDQLETLLREQESALGPDHLDAITTRWRLASWTAETSGPDAGMRMLDIVERLVATTLGPDSLSALILQRDRMRMNGRADIEAVDSLLSRLTPLLDGAHPDVLRTRRLRARALGDQGHQVSAEKEYRVIHAGLLKALGADHRDVRLAWADIGAGDPGAPGSHAVDD